MDIQYIHLYSASDIEKAYMLITKDGYNVTQSAFAVGYTSLSHFLKYLMKHLIYFQVTLLKLGISFIVDS